MKNKFDVFSNKFSHDIFLQKYSKDGVETWADTSKRVTEAVCSQLLDSKTKEKVYNTILERKFIPGGRYLYAAGREFHQVNNCFLFRPEDSRESWAELMFKATASLMTGGGIGAEYSRLRAENEIIRRTGGKSTGPIALMNMVNEAGRYIMQGGQRRSAIWAGLLWSHPDVFRFMHLKDYSKALQEAKLADLMFPLPMELTNISVVYDTEFFIAMENEANLKHELAKKVWLENCKQAFSSAEPGMSFNFRKDNESLRNAPVTAQTRVLTKEGYKFVSELIGIKTSLWTGKQWSPPSEFKKTKKDADLVKVTMTNGRSIICDPEHPFIVKKYDEKGKDKTITLERIAAGKLNLNDKLQSDLPATPISNFNGLESEIRVKAIEVLDYREDVYCVDVQVPEHSFMAEGVIISNCTEVVSEEDSDKCNLGTIWLNRIKDKKDLAEVTKLSTLFLLCGGIYSDVPTPRIKEIGVKNNRIGLGLGGIHEWLMSKGQEYEVTPELHKYLSIYEQESDSAAFMGAKQLGVSVPKGVRAIAPTGTIGLIAETTTGIEPLFCKAYKRRYFKDNKWMYQYVIDGSVKRLMEDGVKIENIKDAGDLTFKQRVKFQADVQNYVDMSISSTCNLSEWGSNANNEGNFEKNAATLLKYAKRLRGFTVYPDGCRQGQPLTRVSLEEALKDEGKVFEETENACLNGVCGL